jgi:hypothetical protein
VHYVDRAATVNDEPFIRAARVDAELIMKRSDIWPIEAYGAFAAFGAMRSRR